MIEKLVNLFISEEKLRNAPEWVKLAVFIGAMMWFGYLFGGLVWN